LQTITFGALAGKTFGAAPFTISATASSHLPVVFASLTTPVCTVSTMTVTIVAAGTCTIQASQAGNATYAPAPKVNQSFTVAKAAQTITLGALAGQTYGVAPFTVSATASSGLAVTFTSITTTVCTVSGSTVTIKMGGTCTIQAAQAGNTSYNAAANVSQSFTVAKGNQTISFGALAGQTYGAAPFAIGATASSGLVVIFSSLTTTVCTVSGSMVTIKAAGTCTIQAAQAGNTSYNAAPNASQNFTVAKANQTITFGALANKTYGAVPFTVSATASSSLAVAFSSTTTAVCTVNSTTVTLVSAGTCTIQAAQAGNGNFNAAPSVAQSFSVALGSQAINFPPIPEQVVGTIPPTLSATASSRLQVTFSSLTTSVCTVSATSLTLVGAGTCTIQASQAGSSGYGPAPSVNQSFAIIVAAQFAPQVMYPVGTYPWGVMSGDFNGDGKADVVVVNDQGGTISIFFGDGTGGLTAPSTVSVGGIFPEQIVVGDFNGDGKVDLAVANVYSKTVAILLGNGNGTFAPPRLVTVGGQPFNLAVADLNRDGKLDLVVVDGSDGMTSAQTVEVLLGNGDGTFQAGVRYPTGASPIGVAIGDFNGDSKLDLAVTNGDSDTLSILLGNGDGTFQPAINYPTAYYPEFIATADLNRDGKADLVILNSSINSISVFLGNGDGTFAARADVTVGQAPQGLAIADFNGDGKLDLAVANSFDNDVSVLLGVGDGTFHGPTLLVTGTYPAGIAVADLNRDGKPDLIVANYESNTASVLLNTANYAPPASVTPVSGTPQSAALNAAYATAFSAVIRDNASNPIPFTPVTFTAPASGASGSFAGSGISTQVMTNASGVAIAPTFTANGTAGSFSVVARAGTVSGAFWLTITAGNSPAFTSAPPPNGTVNLAYSYTATASGAPGPTFSAAANSLPPGLALNSISGLISGTPRTTGTFAGTLTAANGVLPNATQNFAITIAGLAQTITFPALTNKVWGAAPFTVSATTSSGLAVSFASLTTSVCSVNGSTVTIVNVGICTIRASQAGNTTFGPAPNVNQSFSIVQAGQTIAFGSIGNKALGTPPSAVTATASSGLAVSFSSLTTSVCTVSGNTLTLAATGVCTVRAAQAGNTYYIAAPNVDQSFTVTAALVLAPDPATPNVDGNELSLTGTLQAPSNSGVVVNGVPAVVDNAGRFYADHIALSAGQNRISLTLTTFLGQSVTQTLLVNATGTPTPILLTATPNVGVVPLRATFTVRNQSGEKVNKVEFDQYGNGQYVDVTNSNGRFDASYVTVGTYRATVRVTHTSSRVSLATTTVVVQDAADIDRMLQGLWAGMNGALVSGDIGKATPYLSSNAVDLYTPVFSILTGAFPDIVASYSSFWATRIGNDYAEYALTRSGNSGRQVFLIYFVRDEDGIWRVDSM
jgi:hypothetical protein